MNLIEDIGLRADMPPLEEAEIKLDLSGFGQEDALKKLGDMIVTCEKQSVASMFVSFEPASIVGKKCLFGPVGHFIRGLKHNKVIFRSIPLVEENRAGFFILFKY